MGLFYIMPISEEELEYVTLHRLDPLHPDKKAIELRSYGPPMLFWFYLLAILITIVIMATAIWNPLFTAIRGEDFINQGLGLIVLGFICTLPVVILAFYFYQKSLYKHDQNLVITHRVFAIPLKKVRLDLQTTKLEIEHFMDGENYARLSGDKNLRAFYNQGHYNLIATSPDGKKIIVDRSQRRPELEKLLQTLQRY